MKPLTLIAVIILAGCGEVRSAKQSLDPGPRLSVTIESSPFSIKDRSSEEIKVNARFTSDDVQAQFFRLIIQSTIPTDFPRFSWEITEVHPNRISHKTSLVAVSGEFTVELEKPLPDAVELRLFRAKKGKWISIGDCPVLKTIRIHQ